MLPESALGAGGPRFKSGRPDWVTSGLTSTLVSGRFSFHETDTRLGTRLYQFTAVCVSFQDTESDAEALDLIEQRTDFIARWSLSSLLRKVS